MEKSLYTRLSFNVADAVLYVDNDDLRRAKVSVLLASVYTKNVETVASINRAEFEANTYELVFVHHGNSEEAHGIFKGYWDRRHATVVLFSGGYGASHLQRLDPHRIRVSSTLLQDNFLEVINFISQK